MPAAKTFRLTFAPYDRAEFEAQGRRLHKAESLCAFAVLRAALQRTKDKPENPDKWRAWKRFAALMDAFESLEAHFREPVVGAHCTRCNDVALLDVTYLRAEGGVLELSEAEVDELEQAFHSYLKDGLPKGAAQQVAATFAWWDANVKEIGAEAGDADVVSLSSRSGA
jgi:hypothetical protein